MGKKINHFAVCQKKFRGVLWRRDFSYRYKSLQLNLKMVIEGCVALVSDRLFSEFTNI